VIRKKGELFSEGKSPKAQGIIKARDPQGKGKPLSKGKTPEGAGEGA